MGIMTGQGTHGLKAFTLEAGYPWDEDRQDLVERVEVE